MTAISEQDLTFHLDSGKEMSFLCYCAMLPLIRVRLDDVTYDHGSAGPVIRTPLISILQDQAA